MCFHNTDNAFIRFVAIIICTAWILWILLICLIVIIDLFYDQTTIFDKNIRYIIGFITVYSVVTFLFLIQPQCKFCGNKIFKETLQIQKKAKYWAFVNGWSAVVMQIVTRNEFVCMHCGKTVSLKPRTPEP